MNSQTNGSASSYSNSGQKIFFNNQSCTGGSKSQGERVFVIRNIYGDDETSRQNIHGSSQGGNGHFDHEDSQKYYQHLKKGEQSDEIFLAQKGKGHIEIME